ncbi:protein amnionless isoform X2 [Parasteatoda tepidariorum]|uniref:protein amnionless isoform X2 n=1 Tax=Parasteatoda tepidariorum TaxID=114398 RepID=UPI001C72747C|nr:protein amnionless isoform X2 [Parasteatoda tepidariorum]
MQRKLLSIQIFIYFNLIVKCSTGQDVKTWRSSMNFNDVRNWKNGKIPCSNQKVIFPSETPVAIFMPEVLQVSEMLLPMNGELVFPENAVLKIGGGLEKGQCPNDDAEFIPRMDFWYDPSNWNITSSRAFPKKVSTRNSAVPHAFQIPCPMDEAWFPADTTFRAHVIYPMTRVSKIYIGNKDSYQEYNQDKFDMLIRSDTGKLLFPDFPRFRISESTCTDVTGCECGNEGHEVLPTICKFEVPCPELSCSDPIKVVGHCCPMCAAKITFKYEWSFKMDGLMQMYDKYLTTEKFQQVESFTSKLSTRHIQSIFVDNSPGKQLANEVVLMIFDALETASTTGSNPIGIREPKLDMSTLWNSKDDNYGNYTGMSSGSVAAVIMAIICAILAIAFFIYKKRQIPGFSFARFDLRGEKIELELGTTPHEELEPEESPRSSKSEEKSKAFDNPVYGTNITDEIATSSNEDNLGGKDYVENPMFMIFEDSEKKEKS